MTTPLVSIGVPVFNGERYLALALDSLLHQTFRDFEIVLSDNGSNDRTREICEAYAARDGRIRYYRNETNRGAAWNYNNVFKLSCGKYFKWASYDDLCAPSFLERCVEVLEKDARVALCAPKTIILDAEGRFLEHYPYEFGVSGESPHKRYAEFFRRYSEPDFCNPIFGVFRRSVLEKTPLIEGFLCSDKVLVGEVALSGNIHEISEYLFFYRDHKDLSWKKTSHHSQELAWYDPAERKEYVFQYWMVSRKHAEQVRRMRVSAREKFLCFSLLGLWAVGHSKHFAKELVKPLIRWKRVKPLIEPILRWIGIGRGKGTHYIAPRRKRAREEKIHVSG